MPIRVRHSPSQEVFGRIAVGTGAGMRAEREADIAREAQQATAQRRDALEGQRLAIEAQKERDLFLAEKERQEADIAFEREAAVREAGFEMQARRDLEEVKQQTRIQDKAFEFQKTAEEIRASNEAKRQLAAVGLAGDTELLAMFTKKIAESKGNDYTPAQRRELASLQKEYADLQSRDDISMEERIQASRALQMRIAAVVPTKPIQTMQQRIEESIVWKPHPETGQLVPFTADPETGLPQVVRGWTHDKPEKPEQVKTYRSYREMAEADTEQALKAFEIVRKGLVRKEGMIEIQPSDDEVIAALDRRLGAVAPAPYEGDPTRFPVLAAARAPGGAEVAPSAPAPVSAAPLLPEDRATPAPRAFWGDLSLPEGANVQIVKAAVDALASGRQADFAAAIRQMSQADQLATAIALRERGMLPEVPR